MKKSLLIIFTLIFNFFYSLLSLELISKDTIKYSTKNLSKAQGMNIDIYYPKFLKYAEGKRPHIVFKLFDPKDERINSLISVADITESIEDEKERLKQKNDLLKAIKSIGVRESQNIFSKQIFPSDEKGCKEFIKKSNLATENEKCIWTRLEGLEAFKTSTRVKVETELGESKGYMISYYIVFETKLISIAFSFPLEKLNTNDDFKIADLFAIKTANSIVINNLWNK